jgi:hypothetical protein
MFRGARASLLAVSAALFLTPVATAAAAPLDLQAAPDASALSVLADAGDLPSGCSNHWKTPDVRIRYMERETYIHGMSNNCVPYGPVNGSVPKDSTFRLYFSDPYEPAWCYGYSVNLSKLGYVLCDALRT